MLDMVLREPWKHGIVYLQMCFYCKSWVYWALNSNKDSIKMVITLILYISSSGWILIWQIVDNLMGIILLWLEIIIWIFQLSEISAHDERCLAINIPSLNKSTAVLLRVILDGEEMKQVVFPVLGSQSSVPAFGFSDLAVLDITL